MKALIIDDDEEVLDLLTYGLGRDGYEVMGASNGVQGLRRWRNDHPDIVLLDLNLPRLNGFEVCRRIRATSTTPIIVLSGRPGDANVVRALRLGADDYVSKPFSQRQLRARMEAVLRRSKGDLAPQLSGELRVGELELDLQTYNATYQDNPVQLTRVEFRVLHILATNLGRIVPYSRLFEYGWGYDVENCGRDAALLKAHVSHIRDKLQLRNDGPLNIANMRGIGYSLTAKERKDQGQRAS
jgi:DNA-binding response OmpR family regulator